MAMATPSSLVLVVLVLLVVGGRRGSGGGVGVSSNPRQKVIKPMQEKVNKCTIRIGTNKKTEFT